MTTGLVTGGSGYFGSLLVDRLVQRGYDVRVFDLNDAADRRSGVDFVAGDIRDAAAVADALNGCDVVFNNVAQVPLAKDRGLLRSVNVDGTRVLLDQCLRAGVGKVVHTSSSAVFGVSVTNPVLTSTVPRPQEEYGHAKLAAEWACLDAARDGLDVSIVRPRTILGHGRLGIFGILFDWIADGADPIVLGDGSNRYQFVHAEDLADACILAGETERPGVFNIGTDRFGTMFEALDHLCAHADTGARVRRVPARLAATGMQITARLGLTPFAPYHWMMYSKSMWFDTSEAEQQLGWTPEWSTDEMFAHSYDWFVAHRAETGDPAASDHRRSARQGVLRGIKHITRLLPLAKGGPHG